MKKLIVLLTALGCLSACSLLPVAVDRAEERAADVVVDSSERTICRNIPIGTWMRRYGSSVERIQAWQALCANKTATPVSQ